MIRLIAVFSDIKKLFVFSFIIFTDKQINSIRFCFAYNYKFSFEHVSVVGYVLKICVCSLFHDTSGLRLNPQVSDI